MIEVHVTDDIATCQELRRTVFIHEQNVPEHEEIDGLDDTATHLLATRDGAPVGTARLTTKGDLGKIGRVCVLADARGTGLGAQLIEAALAHFRTVPGLTQATLGSQTHAIGFYEKLGFKAHGPEFDDAGIPHRQMTRPL